MSVEIFRKMIEILEIDANILLGKEGGGCGDDKCRGEDCFSVFQDVLVHKLFLFFAVKRVDGPLSGG